MSTQKSKSNPVTLCISHNDVYMTATPLSALCDLEFFRPLFCLVLFHIAAAYTAWMLATFASEL